MTPIEKVVAELKSKGYDIWTVLIPEQCAEVYDDDKIYHVIANEDGSYTKELMPR